MPILELTKHPDFKPAEEPKKPRKTRGLRKDGRIKRTLNVGTKPNGKPDIKYFYGKTITEAEAEREKYKKKIAGGIDVAKESVTVAEWIEEWRTTYKSKLGASAASNLSAYTARINRSIGSMRVVDVRNIHLQKILNETAGMSSSTVFSLRQTMRSVFRKAILNHMIAWNPAEELDAPEYNDGEHRSLEPWETDVVLHHWRIHWFGRFILALMLTGMRPEEGVALKWENVDLSNRVISIKDAAEMVGNKARDRGKTKTEAGIRRIPICDELLAMLQETQPGSRKGYVFLSAKGKQLTESALRRGLDAFLYRAGRVLNGENPEEQQTGRPHRKDLSKAKTPEQRAAWEKKNAQVDAWEAGRKNILFRLYDLRHTFCTALYDAGVDVKTAAYYMGHRNIETTLKIYTHLSEIRKKESAAKMIHFLDSWIGGKGQKEH